MHKSKMETFNRKISRLRFRPVCWWEITVCKSAHASRFCILILRARPTHSNVVGKLRVFDTSCQDVCSIYTRPDDVACMQHAEVSDSSMLEHADVNLSTTSADFVGYRVHYCPPVCSWIRLHPCSLDLMLCEQGLCAIHRALPVSHCSSRLIKTVQSACVRALLCVRSASPFLYLAVSGLLPTFSLPMYLHGVTVQSSTWMCSKHKASSIRE
jgi:hypothetical protein